jgi:Ca2+-binding EF-hand superfamily protein
MITRQSTGSGGLGGDDWMSKRRAKVAQQQQHEAEDEEEEEEDWDWMAARQAKIAAVSAGIADDAGDDDDDGGEALLSRTSTAVMRSLFNVMDVDHSGMITVDNIKTFMMGAGEEMDESDITEMFRYADVTADGMVSYVEFERVVHLHEAEQQTMRELFDALDISGTGVLSAEDLTEFLVQTGMRAHLPTPN